jgi:hypothetical protein
LHDEIESIDVHPIRKKAKKQLFCGKVGNQASQRVGGISGPPGKKKFPPMPVPSGGRSPDLAGVLGFHSSLQGEAV